VDAQCALSRVVCIMMRVVRWIAGLLLAGAAVLHEAHGSPRVRASATVGIHTLALGE
jgi:hypothetical protein